MEAERRFQRRLRQLVEEKYGTLDRFYLETNFSKGHLSHIVRGTQSPSVSTLARLAKLLRVELRDFFIFPDAGAQDEAMGLLSEADHDTVKEILSVLGKRRLRSQDSLTQATVAQTVKRRLGGPRK